MNLEIQIEISLFENLLGIHQNLRFYHLGQAVLASEHTNIAKCSLVQIVQAILKFNKIKF